MEGKFWKKKRGMRWKKRNQMKRKKEKFTLIIPFFSSAILICSLSWPFLLILISYFVISRPFLCQIHLYLLSRMSTLLPLALSKLPLTPTLLLLLPLLFLRASSKSAGCSPLARAYRFSISVKLITPVRRPARCCPGSAAALMTGVDARG